jgi:NhaA family Na+:H+ antiporter
VGLLCGIGFTMSLFIGTLAFDAVASQTKVRVGVITGSLISMIAGYVWLQLTLAREDQAKHRSSDDA